MLLGCHLSVARQLLLPNGPPSMPIQSHTMKSMNNNNCVLMDGPDPNTCSVGGPGGGREGWHIGLPL